MEELEVKMPESQVMTADEGKTAIIERILSSARQKAAGIISDAGREREELLSSVADKALKDKKAEVEAAEKEREAVISRKTALAELDTKKLLLKAKQDLIDRVYREAIYRITTMADNIYRDFIGGIVLKYAESADTVQICKKDAGRLNAEWVDSLAKKRGIKLSLSSDFHEGSGGVILKNPKYDKNLTLDTIVKQMRPKTEGIVAEKLFGGK